MLQAVKVIFTVSIFIQKKLHLCILLYFYTSLVLETVCHNTVINVMQTELKCVRILLLSFGICCVAITVIGGFAAKVCLLPTGSCESDSFF